jgi:hypothetical protein
MKADRKMSTPEGLDHFPTPFHGMQTGQALGRNDVRVATRGPFTRIPETDAACGAGRERHDAAAQQALQINDQVEPGPPQPAEKAKTMTNGAEHSLAQRSAVKREEGIQVRMTVQ